MKCDQTSFGIALKLHFFKQKRILLNKSFEMVLENVGGNNKELRLRQVLEDLIHSLFLASITNCSKHFLWNCSRTNSRRK